MSSIFWYEGFWENSRSRKVALNILHLLPWKRSKKPSWERCPPPRSRGREHPCLRGTLRRSSSPQFTTLTHSLWPSYFYDCSRFIKHSTEILACNWVFISWCSLHATSNVHWILLHTFPPLICLYQFNFQTQPGTPAGLRKHFLPSPPEAPPSIHGQLIWGGVPGQVMGKEPCFQQMVLGQLENHLQKNEVGPCLTPWTWTQNGSKTRDYACLTRKHWSISLSLGLVKSS